MRISVVGGNSQVGTEISFLLREDGLEVIPITRNKIGAAFLRYHGFDCRVADVNRPEDAKAALKDVDVVIIAAYAFDPEDIGGSKRVNEDIIKNCIKFSKPNTKIIYFSSIRAFSELIDKSTKSATFYDREKRRLEGILTSCCKRNCCHGYTLRLGHVFGLNQPKTKKLLNIIKDKGSVRLQTSPKTASNILHTVTLSDAINLCLKGLKPGRYTVVNRPQWTWEEVFSYYTDSKVIFEGTPSKVIQKPDKNLLRLMWAFLRPDSNLILHIKSIMPAYFYRNIKKRYTNKKVLSEIFSLKMAQRPAYIHEFGYMPAPGPFIPGLADTKKLMKNYKKIEHVFSL